MKHLEKKKRDLKRLKEFSEGDLDFLENFKKCNKQAKQFIKNLIKINPYFWDYGYCLDIEYSYLKGLRETLLKEDLFVGVKRECERIQTCLNLLDVICDRNECVKYVPGVTSLLKDVNKSIIETSWELTKHVNLKNAKRFFNNEVMERLQKNVEGGRWIYYDMLRQEKAWNLYHKMRISWMRKWWD